MVVNQFAGTGAAPGCRSRSRAEGWGHAGTPPGPRTGKNSVSPGKPEQRGNSGKFPLTWHQGHFLQRCLSCCVTVTRQRCCFCCLGPSMAQALQEKGFLSSPGSSRATRELRSHRGQAEAGSVAGCTAGRSLACLLGRVQNSERRRRAV